MAYTKKTNTVKKDAKEIKEEVKIEKEIEPIKEKTEHEEAPVTKYKKAEESAIPDDAMIPVTSLYEGDLRYNSKITLNYSVEWTYFGEVVELPFRELKSMVGCQKRFFTEPWISVPADVVKALRAEKYYKNLSLTVEDFEGLFEKTPSEITSIISKLSQSCKNAVKSRAIKMFKNRELDSFAVKEAIEAGLGIKDLFE